MVLPHTFRNSMVCTHTRLPLRQQKRPLLLWPRQCLRSQRGVSYRTRLSHPLQSLRTPSSNRRPAQSRISRRRHLTAQLLLVAQQQQSQQASHLLQKLPQCVPPMRTQMQLLQCLQHPRPWPHLQHPQR